MKIGAWYCSLSLALAACTYGNACPFSIDYVSSLVRRVLSKSEKTDQSKAPTPQKMSLKKDRLVTDSLSKFFAPVGSPFNKEIVITDPLLLQKAASDALHYMRRNKTMHEHVISPQSFSNDILPADKVEQTLEYLVSVIEQDKKHGNFRILDPAFISKHFACIKWSGDVKSARNKKERFITPGKIRLTNYAVYHVTGSNKKTKTHSYALYKLLNNTKELPFTKQEILSGVLERKEHEKKVKSLAWLSRDALEEALMQGTIFVSMPNGKIRAFNVDYNNGIKYDKKIKNPWKQQRYWYFREIRPKLVEKLFNKMAMRKNVIFAGDIFNIGIGKLIAIAHKNPVTKKQEMRLGILADTGSAFIKNLYQLDFFAGVFSSKQKLRSYMKQLPNTTDAYILSVR